MKKSLYALFACFSGIGSSDVEVFEQEEFVPNESQLMSIVNEIFSVDEKTGVARGDLAYYMSPNGNPTVKTWLTNNLLAPRFELSQKNPNITDDMLVEFSRLKGESVDDYAFRLCSIKQDAIDYYNAHKDDFKSD